MVRTGLLASLSVHVAGCPAQHVASLPPLVSLLFPHFLSTTGPWSLPLLLHAYIYAPSPAPFTLLWRCKQQGPLKHILLQHYMASQSKSTKISATIKVSNLKMTISLYFHSNILPSMPRCSKWSIFSSKGHQPPTTNHQPPPPPAVCPQEQIHSSIKYINRLQNMFIM